MSKIIKNNVVYADSGNDRVTQTGSDNNANYPVILSGTADNVTRTEGVRKSSSLTYNPDTKALIINNGTVQVDSVVANSVTCSSMSVQDISNQYTLTKTSGNWNIYDLKAFRCGNVIQLHITLSGNGSAVSAGGDGFVGQLDGPLPTYYVHNARYYSTTAQIGELRETGVFVARNLIGSVTFTTSTHPSFDLMFMVSD